MLMFKNWTVYNSVSFVNYLDQPWAKCGLFAAAALRPIFCGLIAAFCLKKFVKRLMAHTITSSTADESPDFLCAAGKILHRAQSAHPTTKLI